MKNQIKEIRDRLNLSDSEIENKLEITKNSWIDIESGVSEVPVKLFKKLLHLGISVGWLISGNGEMFAFEEQEAINDDNFVTDNFKIGLIEMRLKEIENEKIILNKTLSELKA